MTEKGGREGFSEEVTTELAYIIVNTHRKKGGKAISGRGDCICKGPVAGGSMGVRGTERGPVWLEQRE